MPVNRNISKAITKRILKFADASIKSGQIADIKAFAKIAGMQPAQIYDMKNNGTRHFTMDQLYNIGKRFNLDMNYFIYGKGAPILDDSNKRSISDQLKAIIINLDAASAGKVNG